MLHRSGTKNTLIIDKGKRLSTSVLRISGGGGVARSTLCRHLKKFCGDRTVSDVRHFGADRVVDIQLGRAEGAVHIIVEFYSRGNVVICDHDYRVLARSRSDKKVPFVYGSQYGLSAMRPFRTISPRSLWNCAVSLAADKGTVGGRDGTRDGTIIQGVLNVAFTQVLHEMGMPKNVFDFVMGKQCGMAASTSIGDVLGEEARRVLEALYDEREAAEKEAHNEYADVKRQATQAAAESEQDDEEADGNEGGVKAALDITISAESDVILPVSDALQAFVDHATPVFSSFFEDDVAGEAGKDTSEGDGQHPDDVVGGYVLCMADTEFLKAMKDAPQHAGETSFDLVAKALWKCCKVSHAWYGRARDVRERDRHRTSNGTAAPSTALSQDFFIGNLNTMPFNALSYCVHEHLVMTKSATKGKLAIVGAPGKAPLADEEAFVDAVRDAMKVCGADDIEKTNILLYLPDFCHAVDLLFSQRGDVAVQGAAAKGTKTAQSKLEKKIAGLEKSRVALVEPLQNAEGFARVISENLDDVDRILGLFAAHRVKGARRKGAYRWRIVMELLHDVASSGLCQMADGESDSSLCDGPWCKSGGILSAGTVGTSASLAPYEKDIIFVLQHLIDVDMENEKIVVQLFDSVTEKMVKVELLCNDDVKTAQQNITRIHAGKKKKLATFETADSTLRRKQKLLARELEQMKNDHTARTVGSSVMRRQLIWFEKFHWFTSSEGYIVIAGREAQQNEDLVRKYLRQGDAYAHVANGRGATVVVRNHGKGAGGVIGTQTLEEACVFAVARSSSWMTGHGGDAWWVHSGQVSKTTESGEYLSKGGFMVRGRRNLVKIGIPEMCVAVLWKIDEESGPNHLVERKIVSEPAIFDISSLDYDDEVLHVTNEAFEIQSRRQERRANEVRAARKDAERSDSSSTESGQTGQPTEVAGSDDVNDDEDNEDDDEESAQSEQQHESQPQQDVGKLNRGQRRRRRKMMKKYRGQDEEDRLDAQKEYQAGLSPAESRVAKARAKKEKKERLRAERNQEMIDRGRIVHEVDHRNALEALTGRAAGDTELNRIVDENRRVASDKGDEEPSIRAPDRDGDEKDVRETRLLVPCPHMDDIVLHAVPCVMPLCVAERSGVLAYAPLGRAVQKQKKRQYAMKKALINRLGSDYAWKKCTEILELEHGDTCLTPAKGAPASRAAAASAATTDGTVARSADEVRHALKLLIDAIPSEELDRMLLPNAIVAEQASGRHHGHRGRSRGGRRRR